MIWKTPFFLFLFIPLFLTLFYLLFFSKKRKPSVRWSSLAHWSEIGFSWRVFFKWVPFFLQTLAIVFIIVALARPQRADEQIRQPKEGIDIMIVFDISFSMMAEDMDPGTRLSSAKQVIERFIDSLTSDRAGLILFSGESYTKVPLTFDYSLLKREALGAETSSDIQQGTAIGAAIANAAARLRASASKSRVIILLTDGENNAGNINPATAVQIAKGYGIKIYSIAVGQRGWARIPIKYKDALGREQMTYTNIQSRVNTKLLSQMSKETGGKFYLAKNLKTLADVFDEIGDLEKTKIEVKKWTRFEELFQQWTRPAFFLSLASILLSFTVFGRPF